MAQQFFRRIESFLICNQVEKAIDMLIQFIKDGKADGVADGDQVRNNLIIISANLTEVNHKFNGGLISNEEYALKKNQLIDKVLKIIQGFEKQVKSNPPEVKPKSFITYLLRNRPKQLDNIFGEDIDPEKYYVDPPDELEMNTPGRFFLRGGDREPYFDFRAKEGVLNIYGRSVPEHTVAYYRPALIWLNNFMLDMPKFTEMNLYFEYFDTTSSKVLFDIFNKLTKSAKQKGFELNINWYCPSDDEDMLDIVMDYSSLGLPIKIHEFGDISELNFVPDDEV